MPSVNVINRLTASMENLGIFEESTMAIGQKVKNNPNGGIYGLEHKVTINGTAYTFQISGTNQGCKIEHGQSKSYTTPYMSFTHPVHAMPANVVPVRAKATKATLEAVARMFTATIQKEMKHKL